MNFSIKKQRKAQVTGDQLFKAIKKHDINKVQELLDKGVDLSVQNEGGWTPFYYAILLGYEDIAKILLEHGADPQLFNTSIPIEQREQVLSFMLSNNREQTQQELRNMFRNSPKEVIDFWVSILKTAQHLKKVDLWRKYEFFLEEVVGATVEDLLNYLDEKKLVFKISSYFRALAHNVAVQFDLKNYILSLLQNKSELFDRLAESSTFQPLEACYKLFSILCKRLGREGKALAVKLIRSSTLCTPEELHKFCQDKGFDTTLLEQLFTPKELNLHKLDVEERSEVVESMTKSTPYALSSYLFQSILNIPNAEQLMPRMLTFLRSVITGEETNDKITRRGVKLHEELKNTGVVAVKSLAEVLERFGLLPSGKAWTRYFPISKESDEFWTKEQLISFASQLTVFTHSWLDISKEYKEKGIKYFPHKADIVKSSRVYSGFTKGFAIVLHLPDILPSNVSLEALSKLSSHMKDTRYVPGVGEVKVPIIGWARIIPYKITRITPESKSIKNVWVISEIQSDLLQHTQDLKHMKGVPAGMRSTLENLFKDYHKVLMNLILKKARRAGIDEVWLPTSDEIANSWKTDKPELVSLFQRVYDGLAQFYGRSVTDITQKYGQGVPIEGNGMYNATKFYIFPVEQMMDRVAQLKQAQRSLTLEERMLFAAIDRNDIEMAKELLDRGVSLDIRDTTGQTPLHRAAYQGHVGMVKFLLDRGADINARDEDARTPLYKAVMGRRGSTVKLLLERGADPNLQGSYGLTPLHAATYSGRFNIAKLLLEHGANPSVQDDDGDTPLHIAAEMGRVKITKLLLEYEVDPEVKNKDGKTPRDIAQEKDHVEIIKLLGKHVYPWKDMPKLSIRQAQVADEPDFRENRALIDRVMTYIETYVNTWFRQMRDQIGPEYAGFSDIELIRDGLKLAIQMLKDGALRELPENLRSERDFYIFILHRLKERHPDWDVDEGVVDEALTGIPTTSPSEESQTVEEEESSGITFPDEDDIELSPEQEDEILAKLIELKKKKEEQGLTEEEQMWYELYSSLLGSERESQINSNSLVEVVTKAAEAFIEKYVDTMFDSRFQDELHPMTYSKAELRDHAFVEFVKQLKEGKIIPLPLHLLSSREFFKRVLARLREQRPDWRLSDDLVDDAFIASFRYDL